MSVDHINIAIRQSAIGGSDGLSQTLHAVLNTVDDALLLLDVHLKVSYINHKAVAIGHKAYGFTCKKGDYIIDLMPLERKQPIKDMLLKVLGGEVVHYEIEISKGVGEPVWLECCYKPIVVEKQVTGICVILKDISKEKELESQEQKRRAAEKKYHESRLLFETFMEHTPLTAWITDEKGYMHYLNPAFCRMYHIPKMLCL